MLVFNWILSKTSPCSLNWGTVQFQTGTWKNHFSHNIEFGNNIMHILFCCWGWQKKWTKLNYTHAEPMYYPSIGLLFETVSFSLFMLPLYFIRLVSLLFKKVIRTHQLWKISTCLRSLLPVKFTFNFTLELQSLCRIHKIHKNVNFCTFFYLEFWL